jgi:hypothetical protein
MPTSVIAAGLGGLPRQRRRSPGRQLGEGDRADRHLVRELCGVDPAAQNQHVGVEKALPRRFAALQPRSSLVPLGGGRGAGDCQPVGRPAALSTEEPWLRIPQGRSLRKLSDAAFPALAEFLGMAAEGSARRWKETVMNLEIAVAAALGLRATQGVAASALPCAPVLPERHRRHLARRLLRPHGR